MAEEIIFTDADFDAVTGTGVSLVDFWAPWCGPCRMQAPAVERIAELMKGRVKVGKLNVDENPFTASRFGVRGIPTILVLKDGKEVDRFVGVQPEDVLLDALRAHLAS